MDALWLGYNGLTIPLEKIIAVVLYRPAWDGHILRTYGRLPINVRAVVVTEDGGYYPAGRTMEELHTSWATWRKTQP